MARMRKLIKTEKCVGDCEAIENLGEVQFINIQLPISPIPIGSNKQRNVNLNQLTLPQQIAAKMLVRGFDDCGSTLQGGKIIKDTQGAIKKVLDIVYEEHKKNEKIK